MTVCPACGAENPDGFKFCGQCAAPLVASPDQPEERKVVTTLFCDLVSFTAMSERAYPEDVASLLGEYFSRATKVIGSYGGTVEKFIGDARLEAAAPPMGVAVGTLTHERTERVIVNDELPSVTARGKSEPVAAWLATGTLARRDVEARSVDLTPLIGREVEITYLSAVFDKAMSQSTAQFTRIVGEPGVGKSRLVRELSVLVDAKPDMTTWRQGTRGGSAAHRGPRDLRAAWGQAGAGRDGGVAGADIDAIPLCPRR
jgi:hypothetical protein